MLKTVVAGLIGLIYLAIGVYWQFIEMSRVQQAYAGLSMATPMLILVAPWLFILFGAVLAPLSIYLKKAQYFILAAVFLPVLLYVWGRVSF